MTTSLDRFAAFLEQAERSPLTIKNYLSDLRAFTTWFEETNGDPFEPAKITPTDLREYKRWMVTHCGLRPNSINRKLAKDIDDLEPRLTRHGYNAKVLAEVLNINLREIKSLLRGQLAPGWAQELQNEMRAAGIPL